MLIPPAIDDIVQAALLPAHFPGGCICALQRIHMSMHPYGAWDIQ
jgi:hypothetical protein